MIRIPVCFSSEILGRRDKERDHGPCAYCNSFSWLALTLAAGAGLKPGDRQDVILRINYPRALVNRRLSPCFPLSLVGPTKTRPVEFAAIGMCHRITPGGRTTRAGPSQNSLWIPAALGIATS